MTTQFQHPVLNQLRLISLAAGEAILAHYQVGVRAQAKADGSPITAADRAAHEIIIARLPEVLPGVPIISEEAFDPLAALPAGAFWLVDPLDGTKEFIKRNGEFTVNIALIRDASPVLGVVHAPVSGESYGGDVGTQSGTAREAWRWSSTDASPKAMRVRAVPSDGYTVLASRSHQNAPALAAFLTGRRVANVINAGSSLKFCLLACGEADLYPRFGPTMEWDTAAGHAVLLAAGGSVKTVSGEPLRYGKPGLRNPDFIASSE